MSRWNATGRVSRENEQRYADSAAFESKLIQTMTSLGKGCQRFFNPVARAGPIR